jgi:ATP-dependent exoDNAse (exonuclease V) beta subunit
VTATEHAAAGGAPPVRDVAVESVGPAGPRPHGRRFGVLVHALLATVDLDADRTSVADAATLQGRLLGAPAEEIASATDAVLRALAHPVLRRAAVAAGLGQCRRECPIGVEVDGALIEGVVDAAFHEDRGGWTVVDFKTDVEIAGRLEEYRRQVGVYVDAIRRATGVAAHGVLLQL